MVDATVYHLWTGRNQEKPDEAIIKTNKEAIRVKSTMKTIVEDNLHPREYLLHWCITVISYMIATLPDFCKHSIIASLPIPSNHGM